MLDTNANATKSSPDVRTSAPAVWRGPVFSAALLVAGCAPRNAPASPAPPGEGPGHGSAQTTAASHEVLATVRYQVGDVERSVAFYTQRLGFTLELRSGRAFAAVTKGTLRLVLSGPGSSGARPMPDGRKQEPGGWNRIVLYVDDLGERIAELERVGVRFRNAVETGPGGSQVQIEDPDGNPIELHEAPKGAGAGAGAGGGSTSGSG